MTEPYERDDSHDDWVDPTYVLGAVLAQMEDLDVADKLTVLSEALAAVAAEVRR